MGLGDKVPWRLRTAVREAASRLVFPWAMQLATRNMKLFPSARLLRALRFGWNNNSFAAGEYFLGELYRRVPLSRGPILECGSGLTTIALAMLAVQYGLEVWSLEHSMEWLERIVPVLNRYDLDAVHVCYAPLRDYGGFEWYTLPESLPGSFSLVACDGPPADSALGGRYGLLPVMRDRIARGATILLHDAHRESEQTIVRRWLAEADMTLEMRITPRGAIAVFSLPK